MKLFITGGRLRKNGYELGEGKYYDAAVLLLLDTQSGRYEELVVKSSGGKHYPETHPNLQFTNPCIHKDTLWLPTDTEIYELVLPVFEIRRVLSHNCFQNIHSVHLFQDELVVTSTGLDQIVFLNRETGAIARIESSLNKDPWYRFDPDIDYRKVHSTRPHAAHPNYVLSIDNQLWVTRCKQEDIINLADKNRTVPLTGTDCISIHDGVTWHDKVVFTRVDGKLIILNTKTMLVEEQIDVFAKRTFRPYGWCRGLCIDGETAYIAYSALRKTKVKSKLKYLAQGNLKYFSSNRPLIVKFDLSSRQVDKIYEIGSAGIDAIYAVKVAAELQYSPRLL